METRRVSLIANQTKHERLANTIFTKLNVPVMVQVIIGYYIVDFVGADRNFILEIDGATHTTRDGYDDRRSQFLSECGFEIYRIDNTDVNEHNLAHIIDKCPPASTQYMRRLITLANRKRGSGLAWS